MDKGWHNGTEINTAVFDPEKIELGEMEEALKKAQTYIRTLVPTDHEKSFGGGH